MSVRPPGRWRFGQPVDELLRVLERGGIVAIPTESSYGLAVDPRISEGVEAVYEVKGRGKAKPLPVVVADAEQAMGLGIAPSPRLAAAAAIWPAPLSVLLPLDEPLPAAAGGMTLAVRVPAHRGLRRLLIDLGCALTATSANRSGEPPILDPEALEPLLSGRLAVIVDGGLLPGGPPSTLVEWASDGRLRVLRQGAYPAEMLVSRLSPVASAKGSTHQDERPMSR